MHYTRGRLLLVKTPKKSLNNSEIKPSFMRFSTDHHAQNFELSQKEKITKITKKFTSEPPGKRRRQKHFQGLFAAFQSRNQIIDCVHNLSCGQRYFKCSYGIKDTALTYLVYCPWSSHIKRSHDGHAWDWILIVLGRERRVNLPRAELGIRLKWHAICRWPIAPSHALQRTESKSRDR